MRRRRYNISGTKSSLEPYEREELGGLKIGERVSWKEEIDEVIYVGSISQLIEHPIYGDMVTAYCHHGGYRTKRISEVSKKLLKRRGRGRPRKNQDE